MTFRPPSGTTSTEKIEDLKLHGFTFTDRTKQFVQGGVVRMLPELTGDFQPLGTQWPNLNWDYLDEFPYPLENNILEAWAYTGPSSKTFPGFAAHSQYLRFELTGDIEFLHQTEGGAAGKTRFPDNAGNSAGWVLQTRVEVFDSPTGDNRDGASFLFDDGTYRDEIKFAKDRVYLKSDPDVGISGDFSRPTSVRVMVRGSDVWLWADGGAGIKGEGALAGASSAPTLQIGAPNTGIEADVRFDYVYQRYAFTADTPEDLATGFGFDTTQQTCQLPVHAPARLVSNWEKAIVQTSHGESDLEIIEAFEYTTDFTEYADNVNIFDVDPDNWQPLGGANPFAEMNVDYSGGEAYAHSASQYCLFKGAAADLKADHYVEVTHGPARISDGAFIADVTPRYNPYLLLKHPRNAIGTAPEDRYGIFCQWFDGSGVDGTVSWIIYVIDWDLGSAVAVVDSTVETATVANVAIDGRKARAEIRGRTVSFYVDLLDGNGWVKKAEGDVPDAYQYDEEGYPGVWLGPILGSSPQVCLDQFTVGNFEGETNINIGTTRMRVEYSHDRGETWTLSKVDSITEVPVHEIDLSDVPVAGSGQDALRFSIEQQSPGGLAEPIRVDQVTVKAAYDTSGVDLYPDWGPKIGGTSVSLKLRDDAYLNCGVRPSLAELTAYGSKGADTSLTGDYATSTSFPGVGQAYGSPGLLGSPTVAFDAIAPFSEGNYDSLAAQAVWGGVGDGLQYSLPSTAGLHILEGYLQVQEGSVQVELDSDVHTFHKGTYVDLRSLGLLWEATGAGTLKITGAAAGSVWKHRLEAVAPYTLAGTQSDAQVGHRTLRAWAYYEGFGTGQQAAVSTLDTSTGASGLEIGVTSDGRPYIRAKDSLGVEDALTGEFPLVVGEITHLEGGVVGYDDGVALQIFKNGETCGQKRTNLQDESYGHGRTLGLAQGSGSGDPRGSAVRLAEVGAGVQAPDAQRVVTDIGLANPVFELDRNWPVRDSTRLLLDLDRKEGAIYDRSGYGNYPVIPEDYRRRTVRGADGYWGRSVFFVSEEGGMEVPYSAGLSPDTGTTVSLFAKAYTDPSQATQLWSHLDDSGYGWEMAIDTYGYLRFTVAADTGSLVHTHTGALVGVNAWRPVMVQYDPQAGTVRSKVGKSDWEQSAGAPSISSFLTGESQWIGRGAWGLLDEVAYHREILADSLWDTLTGDSAKYTPDEPITLRGVGVTSTRHWGTDEKFFRTPTGDLGDADVNVTTYGKAWPAVRPFFYTDAYDRVVDQTSIVGQVYDTKSPFRIGNKVPDGAVNLALVNSPGLTIHGNLSFIDMSEREIANIAFYNQGDFVVQGPEVTGDNSGEFAYPPSIDTEEIRISNRSVMRKNFKQPRPLFYMHLLGRGRFYVYNPDAMDATDVDLIRQGIRVQDANGLAVSLEDFAWDIEVQTTDYYQNLLPENHFAVVFYCERIPHGETYFVVYDAANASQGYLREPGRREVINPVPIFTKVAAGSDLGDFEYSMDLDTGGSYSLRIQRN